MLIIENECVVGQGLTVVEESWENWILFSVIIIGGWSQRARRQWNTVGTRSYPPHHTVSDQAGMILKSSKIQIISTSISYLH